MNKLISGLKLLTFILFTSTISCISLILPYVFYGETGNKLYLVTYLIHFFVVAYLLGNDE